MVFPQNPVTTNTPKQKPLFDFDRAYSGLKNSLGRVYEQLPNAPDIRGAIQYMADNPSSRIGTDRPFKAAEPVSPIQGALTTVPDAERSGPMGGDLRRGQAPTGAFLPSPLPLNANLPDRVPMDPGAMVPGDVTAIRGRRPTPSMDIPGSVITPEGMLADRIAGMSMQPDPAEVAEQTAIARALGEQRYNESDVARMQGGRMADMTANRNMGQMAGGNYADMTPERAAVASRNMYRGGGMGGASMGAREDAIEQALRAQPAAGPSLQERTAGTRQEMQGMVAQALQAQGGEMNPQAGFEQNARMLQPGTTLRGTSADGTPMIVSRGSAGTLDDRTRDDRRDQYRTARRERAGELRNFRQNQNAMRNEAMREAANNPMNSPFMRALAMNNPDGTARLLQAQGNMQLGQAEIAQRGEAAARQFQLETERLRLNGVISEAEARERNARAEVSTAEAGAITTASTAEAQATAQRNAERMTAIQGGMAPPSYTDGLFEDPAARGSATVPPQSVSQALRRVEQTSPAVDRLAGSGVSAGLPSGYANAIEKRIESGAMYSDSDLQSMQANYQARALSDPNFKPNDGGLLVASGAIPSENTMFQQMLHERMVQPQPITADEVIQLRKKAKESNAAAKRESMANNRTESLPNNNYDTGRFVGMP